MTKFGLDQSIIDSIISVSMKYPAIERVVIYGSRATGAFKNYSDIDLAIYAPTLSEREFARLCFELDELPIVFKIDVVHIDRLKDERLKSKIAREGRALPNKKQENNGQID